MLLEIYLSNFLNLIGGAGVVIYAISIALLYTSFITAFAAIRNVELQTKRLPAVLAVTIFVHFAVMVATTYPLIALGRVLSEKVAATFLGIPVNAILGVAASLAYKKCNHLEVIIFWVIAGLILDVIALQLHGEVFIAHPKMIE
ncbi:hypothetical protein [Archaeoglobus neptunius]|uniref:hypothetical protein n=1 Tax=Archaeoglobus neptunius TaxID=2798580 RepID=UPI0019282C03|nr:hypothetical protein [Archaeoglobus neptunius]